MNKFYVYTSNQKNRNCIYVDEQLIEEFAAQEFDPAKMEYSGVIVEADSAKEAHRVYNTFGNNEILWTDEPRCTVKKRKLYETKIQNIKSQLTDLQNVADELKEINDRLLIQALSERIAGYLLQINQKMSLMAKLVRRYSNDNPEMTTKELYERIKTQFIEQLSEYNYDGDSSVG